MTDTDHVELLDRYRRLLELSRDLASTLDLTELLNRIVHAAADLCLAEAASILLYDEVKQELYFEAATNLEEPLMRGLVVPVENSIAGWIVTNRQPRKIDDTQHDPRHFGGVGKSTNVTTRSLLGAPLIAKDKVIGVLETINKLEGSFTSTDIDLLITLSAQAAVAIENARLFQQTDLISELVHELRTPLTSLNTAARLLVRPQITDDVRRKIVDTVFRETERLNDLTTSFLDLSRLESGRVQFQPQVFELRPMLLECVNVMFSKALEKDIEIVLDVTPTFPQIKADRDKIKQVVLNLISNAIKYNRPGGLITIRGIVFDYEVVLQVIDTGPGIPPEYLPHIFEKFYRVPGSERTAQGTGLGLSICQRIIHAHRGEIEVSSQLGVGSTFSIHLPIKVSGKVEDAPSSSGGG